MFDAQSRAKTKSFEELVSRCQKFSIEFVIFFWFETHSNTKYLLNSFEHEIFAFHSKKSFQEFIISFDENHSKNT